MPVLNCTGHLAVNIPSNCVQAHLGAAFTYSEKLKIPALVTRALFPFLDMKWPYLVSRLICDLTKRPRPSPQSSTKRIYIVEHTDNGITNNTIVQAHA